MYLLPRKATRKKGFRETSHHRISYLLTFWNVFCRVLKMLRNWEFFFQRDLEDYINHIHFNVQSILRIRSQYSRVFQHVLDEDLGKKNRESLLTFKLKSADLTSIWQFFHTNYIQNLLGHPVIRSTLYACLKINENDLLWEVER